jgi:hypothetical protein
LKMETERFHVRIGMDTGRVLRKEGDVFGNTVNVASRMETQAPPGDIYLTQDTHEKIKEHVRCTHLGTLEVKGVTGGVVAYSAQEPLIDIDKIISEPKVVQETAAGIAEAGSLLNLHESMFQPEFSPPGEVRGDDNALITTTTCSNDIYRTSGTKSWKSLNTGRTVHRRLQPPFDSFPTRCYSYPGTR